HRSGRCDHSRVALSPCLGFCRSARGYSAARRNSRCLTVTRASSPRASRLANGELMRLTQKLFLLFLICSRCASTRAAEPIQLFNGKDLSNFEWVSSKPDVKMDDVWSMHDGILHCKGTPAGYIKTKDQYTNFILHVEWRFIKEGNGGVLIRKTGPDKVWPKSIECQLQSKNAGDFWNIDD